MGDDISAEEVGVVAASVVLLFFASAVLAGSIGFLIIAERVVVCSLSCAGWSSEFMAARWSEPDADVNGFLCFVPARTPLSGGEGMTDTGSLLVRFAGRFSSFHSSSSSSSSSLLSELRSSSSSPVCLEVDAARAAASRDRRRTVRAVFEFLLDGSLLSAPLLLPVERLALLDLGLVGMSVAWTLTLASTFSLSASLVVFEPLLQRVRARLDRGEVFVFLAFVLELFSIAFLTAAFALLRLSCLRLLCDGVEPSVGDTASSSSPPSELTASTFGLPPTSAAEILV
jgi:hypothetical protein